MKAHFQDLRHRVLRTIDQVQSIYRKLLIVLSPDSLQRALIDQPNLTNYNGFTEIRPAFWRT